MAPGLWLLALGLFAAGPDSVTATWRQQPVVIDGQNDEWQQGLLRLDDTPASLGVMNDGEYVYVAIAVSDQAQRRRMLVTGLDVWFDKDGGKKKRFGIELPRVTMARDESGAPSMELTYLYLLGPEENQKRRVELQEVSGIAAARVLSEGTLIIELKVPLALVEAGGGQPAYGVGAAPGKKIGVGLESPKFDRQMAQGGGGPGGRRPGGGGGWGGGGGGMGRGGGGGGGMGRGGMGGGGGRGPGGPGGPGGDMGKPLDVWTTVQLAAAR